MKRELCIDFRIIDAEHIVILYSYQIVVIHLSSIQPEPTMGGKGVVSVPVSILKLSCEQDGLYLAPCFDINSFPIMFIRT